MNKELEEQISAQIDTINDMLHVVCKELNEYKDIDDYEIELQETEYKNCIDAKVNKEYEIIVTCKRSLKDENK